MSSELRTAAVFNETLSAPARKIRFMSSSELIPPPTVKESLFLRLPLLRPLPSFSALQLRRKYRGIRAHQRLVIIKSCQFNRITCVSKLNKLNPFTTRPSFTSRQGIIRFVNSYTLTFQSSFCREYYVNSCVKL